MPRPIACLSDSESFSLLPRPPPTSTLFPYTTLFRSEPGGCLRERTQPRAHHQASRRHRLHRRDAGGLREYVGVGGDGGDRKSTRLNSSHLGISYAVFCLKKKTSLPGCRT